MKHILVFILLFGAVPSIFSQDTPDPKTAFLKSMVLPGWGHYHVDQTEWMRGQYHLAAEGTMILSFLGLNIHSSNLRQNWFTYAHSEAGVQIKGRERSFQLAVGDFNSLEAYNAYQEQSRNWNRILDDTPENRWSWENTGERLRYNDLRNRFEKIDQQLPAIIGLMVVNRVISGISAYNRANKMETGKTAFRVAPFHGSKGIVAYVKIHL